MYIYLYICIILYNIYIGFYFFKYILRFHMPWHCSSTRSRRPRRSRQGRNPRFGGSGNCLGKCFRKCLGSCLGSWGTMDFSISLTCSGQGIVKILPCTGTQVVRKCIWLQIYPTISNIFSLSPRKRRLFETAAMAGASPGSSHYAASKRQKSHHRASGPSHTQKLFKLRHSAPVWSRTRCTGFDLWGKDQMGTWWFETFRWELVVVFYKIHLAGEVTKAVHPTSAAGQSCILKGRGNAKPMESALTSCMTSLQNARRMFWRVFTKWAIVPTFGIATASKVSQSNVLLCCALWRPTCCVASVGKKRVAPSVVVNWRKDNVQSELGWILQDFRKIGYRIDIWDLDGSSVLFLNLIIFYHPKKQEKKKNYNSLLAG